MHVFGCVSNNERMGKMKKLIALSLALVLVLSMCATAFAVTPPTAVLYKSSKNLTVKRGSTAVWTYALKSNSYTVKGSTAPSKSQCRARVITRAYKGSTRISSDTDAVWNGIVKYKVSMYIPSNVATGKYKNWWRTYAKTNAGKWKTVSTKTSYWYIK